MDWTIILDMIGQAGVAAAPVVGSALMMIVGFFFYRATGFLPGFLRAYIEDIYRKKEADFREAITKALVNGITSAVSRGRSGPDALQEAIDHAIKTNPQGVAHFEQTSNMDRATLQTMAERAALDLGIKLTAEKVVVDGSQPA